MPTVVKSNFRSALSRLKKPAFSAVESDSRKRSLFLERFFDERLEVLIFFSGMLYKI